VHARPPAWPLIKGLDSRCSSDRLISAEHVPSDHSEMEGEFEFLKEELELGTAETLFTVDTAALLALGRPRPVGHSGSRVPRLRGFGVS